MAYYNTNEPSIAPQYAFKQSGIAALAPLFQGGSNPGPLQPIAKALGGGGAPQLPPQVIQQVLAKQLAQENNLEPAGIDYDKNGTPRVDYKKPEIPKEKESAMPSTNAGIDALLTKADPTQLPLSMQPSVGGFNPSQIQAAIQNIGSGTPAPAAPPPSPAGPPPINTNLPAIQSMMQNQAMGSNPVVQRIMAQNRDAQDQQAAQEQQQGGATPSGGSVMAIAPDGTPGMIPAAQVAQAKAKGYKISGF